MMSDEEFDAWLRNRVKDNQRTDAIARTVIYGGIGLWVLYAYFTADAQKQDNIGWGLLGGLVYFAIDSRLRAIQDKLQGIERRLNAISK